MLARSAITRVAPPLARASSSANHHARQFQPKDVSLRQVADEGGATTRQIEKAVERTKNWYASKVFDNVPRRGQEQTASSTGRGGAPGGGLGNRLAKRRGEKGGVFDLDAKEISLPSHSAGEAAPELSAEDESWVRRAPLPKRANAYSPSNDRSSSSSRPSTNASSTSPRPPRTPSKFGGPKSSSSSSPRSPRPSSRPSTSSTPLRAPSKFSLSGPLDLAALIQEDLRSRAIKLGRSVEDIEAGSKAQQEARLAAHKELMGDYSRFWPTQEELAGGKTAGKGREVMGRARKVLAANSSVGLEQREVFLGAVEKVMTR